MTATHVVALSGGKDSTAMALRLMEIEPRDYKFVITPTGDELPDMYEHWRNIGQLLGQQLTVLTTNRSLNGLIKENNVLPNWRMRWCTKQLKIDPFNAFLLKHLPAVSYVGLRADEPAEMRRGAIFGGGDQVTQRYPLREWGWDINDVFKYLAEKNITIPPRTDCARCFYQTLGEWWWLWHDYPTVYQNAVEQETATGHTFRSPQRDKWPTSLADLRLEFEKARIPRGGGQYDLMGQRPNMCRVCSL